MYVCMFICMYFAYRSFVYILCLQVLCFYGILCVSLCLYEILLLFLWFPFFCLFVLFYSVLFVLVLFRYYSLDACFLSNMRKKVWEFRWKGKWWGYRKSRGGGVNCKQNVLYGKYLFSTKEKIIFINYKETKISGTSFKRKDPKIKRRYPILTPWRIFIVM